MGYSGFCIFFSVTGVLMSSETGIIMYIFVVIQIALQSVGVISN